MDEPWSSARYPSIRTSRKMAMSQEIENKVVVITGASSGLGEAAALRHAQLAETKAAHPCCSRAKITKGVLC